MSESPLQSKHHKTSDITLQAGSAEELFALVLLDAGFAWLDSLAKQCHRIAKATAARGESCQAACRMA